jgi:RNA polymerase-binding transcription factor DksA
MDDIDLAQEREAFYQEKILNAALRPTGYDDDDPLIINGVRCCLTSEDPIPLARLKANPKAKRCVPCESKRERMEKR